jgi:hypothetical protein
MDVFEYIRENTDILEVARYYGLEVDRHGKMRCLWHGPDNHPSCTIKFNRVRCWACGASASPIDLVCQLFGLEPLQAVQKINADFGLGLDLNSDYKPDMEAIEKRKRDKEIEKAWNDWCEQEYRKLAAVARGYWEVIQNYKPKFEENYRPEYVEAIHNIEVVHYKLDILLKGSTEEKISLFKAITDMKGVKKAG